MRKFYITKAGKAVGFHNWNTPTELTFDKLIEWMSSHDERETKEGPCYIAGICANNQRAAKYMQQIDLLVYDIDGGQTAQQIDEAMTKAGVIGLMHSSFSHLTTSSKIPSNQYESWSKQNGKIFPPNAESMREYCADKKPHLTNIDYKGLGERKRAEEDRYSEVEGNIHYYKFHHDPVEKYRVIVPLKNPIVLAHLGTTSSRVLAEYKAIYFGVGTALGLNYDPACCDPSRVFYFPAMKPGGVFDVTYTAQAYNLPDLENPDESKLLDWEKYPRISEDVRAREAKEKRLREKPSEVSLNVVDKNGRHINLLKWYKDNHDFDIEDLLRRVLPDDYIGKDRPGKTGYHIVCPYESDHSAPGGDGTFCANGEDGAWSIYCTHASCLGFNRRTLDYLAEFIRQGFVTADDLGIPLPVNKEDFAQAMGIDPATLPDNLLDEDEDDGAVEEVTIAVDASGYLVPEDAALEASAVYDLALNAMKEAKYIGDIRTAARRMLDRQCHILLEDITEVIAKSPLGGASLKRLLRSYAHHFNSDVDELIELIRINRDDEKNIKIAIADLHARGLAGNLLADELKRIADFYFTDRKEVQKLFDNYQSETITGGYNDDVTFQVNKLSERYAKVIIGKDLVFVDKQRSRLLRKPVLLSPNALSGVLRNRQVRTVTLDRNGNPKTKTRKIYDVWGEEALNIEEYDGVTMVPGKPERYEHAFNVWDNKNNNFSVKPEKGDVSIITDHIKKTWCGDDDKLFGYVMMWLADIVQHPGNRPHTALLLMGGQGTGKSIIFDLGMSKILGGFYSKSAKRDDIVGKFNGMLVGKLLWLSEESLFAGDKVSMQVLKDRITSPTIDVEYKGVDKFPFPAFTRYVFTSNMLHATDLEHDDRRFVVLQSTNEYQRNITYFKKMADYFNKENGAAHLLHYLLNFDPAKYGYTWDDLMDAPQTEFKRAQIEMSLGVAEMFFVELLKWGSLTDTPSNVFVEGNISWPLDTPLESKGYVIHPRILKNAFEAYLRHHGGSSTAKYDRNKYTALFKKYLGEGKSPSEYSTVVRVGDQTKRCLILKDRRVAIEAAISRRHLCEADLKNAIDNPTSHAYNESDVL